MSGIKKILIVLGCFITLSLAMACVNDNLEDNESGVIKNSWITSSLDLPSSYKNYCKKSTTVVLAKGEFESFQLALQLDSVKEVKIKREEASSLLKFQCRKLVVFGGVEDVLVPVEDNISPTGDTLKLWITYEADRAIDAGTYHEKISFSTPEMTKTIDVTVEVRNITMPVTPSIPITFGIFQKAIVNSEDAEVHVAKRKEYFELLFDHRISPYLVNWGAPNFHLYTQSSPYDWNDPRTANYIQDPRFAAIALPYWDKSDNELSELYGVVENAGLLGKSYVYFFDEPRSLDDHDKVMAGVKRINTASPKLKINLPIYCGLVSSSNNIFEVFDFYKGYPLIFNTSIWALKDKEDRAYKCANSLDDGQEWWTYVCTGQTPGFTHNTTPTGTRSILWRSWKEGSTGYLYWAVNDYFGIEPLVLNSHLKPGDGSLVFPGSSFGCDTPVASVRLERFRDSAEDYELLLMHEKKYGRQSTLELLGKVYEGPNKQTLNVQDIENFRIELMTTIED